MLIKKWIVAAAAVLILAGCTSAPPTETIGLMMPISKATRTTAPQATAIPWRAAAGPITANDASRIRPIGSLVGQSVVANQFVFTQKSTGLITRDGSGNAFIWDLQTGRRRAGLNNAGVLHTAFYSPDDTQIVSIGQDNQLRVWDAQTGSQFTTLTMDSKTSVYAFGARGGTAVVVNDEGTVTVWQPATARGPAFTIAAPSKERPADVTLSPDQKYIVIIGPSQIAAVYDGQTGVPIKRLDMIPVPVSTARFSPDGTRLALTSGQSVFTLNIPDFIVRNQLRDNEQIAERALAWSPDSKYIASAGRDSVLIWTVDNGFQSGKLIGHADDVVDLAWSPDSSLLVTVGFSKAGAVYLWDGRGFLQSNTPLQRAKLALAADQIFRAAWSPDSRYLLLADARGPIIAWGIPPTAP